MNCLTLFQLVKQLILKQTSNILFKTFFFALLFFIQGAHAQFSIPEKPRNIKEQTSLYDYKKLLSPQKNKFLKEKLIRYSDSTSTQIVIAIIASTKGESIQFLGTKWAHQWGIGQEQEDNGIFILLARDDREISINTGYGVEHLLTDALSRRVIENIIIPEFKNGDYYAGLNKGADAIFEILKGTFKENRNFTDSFDSRFMFFLVFFLIIIIYNNIKKRGGAGSGGIFDTIILSNAGRTGGYSRGSSSSGSFGGGFGGGGFGGGGASGSW